MLTQSLPERAVDPRRYFESVEARRDTLPEHNPVCLYLETTNRCNLLCTTCPRTYEELEPPADMSWELFTSIVDQVPGLQRAVLHGVGEPMLVKNLPKMVRYLKDRGTYVLFNTNGTVLNERNGRALIAAGLDELRVSLDAANEKSYVAVRGKNLFQPHSQERSRLPRSAGTRGLRAPARIGVAHWVEGDDRRAAGIREDRGERRGAGSLSAAPGFLREGSDRARAPRSGALRPDEPRGGSHHR